MNRRVVAWLSALVIIFQMVVLPLGSALAHGSSHVGCDHAGAVHTWHPEDGCHHSAGSAHACHCVHVVPQTPAVGDLVIVAAVAPSAQADAGRLAGPAYSAPLYDFLRPPN